MDPGGCSISPGRSDFLSVVTADQHVTKEQAQVKVSVLTPREQRTLLVAQTDTQIAARQVVSVPWWGQTEVLGGVHFRWAMRTEPVGIFHSCSVFERVLQRHHGCNLFYPSVELHSSRN